MATTETEKKTVKVLDLLGGVKVLRRDIDDAARMRDAVRRGLPFKSMEVLAHLLGMPTRELAKIVGVASRTLARRKAARRLSAVESDRLYRIAFALLLAIEALGSVEKAQAWLETGNRALGGQVPLSLLDTEIGERQVEDVLNRINFGVYS